MIRFLLIVSLVSWCGGCSAPTAGPNVLAPELHAKSLVHEAPDVSLSDFPGRFVLVDFWATWCAPCREEVPTLKGVYERFGNDRRFAMLSVSLDRGPSAPRQFAAQHQMNWSQAFGGSASEQDRLRAHWNIQAIPAIFLIDPRGNVVASDLRGEQIEQAIARALHRAQP